ncbi:CWF19-like protein 1 [Schistocerca gregaria]|uniref:CWF19-like protein 1 n=1 Tax=Schistocerca gregaria TaxID=7010 RepID=UPI00211EA387|nr:CWF19-like protein 1 [Schistocerca gregaria]
MLEMDFVGIASVARAAAHLTPRYHFAASPMHVAFEMAPYKNDNNRPMTRFVALADAFNKKKQKYVYALSATPLRIMNPAELFHVPEGVKESPLTYWHAANRTKEKKNASRWNELDPLRADSSWMPGSNENSTASKRNPTDHPDQTRYNPKRHRRASLKCRQHPMMNRMQGCWFCLSNPEVEQHLIFSVGEEAYLAMAKGGITNEHILIIPIDHGPSISSVNPSVWTEITKYLASLSTCFKSEGNAMLAWESAFKKNSDARVHAHLQIVAVPESIADEIGQRFQRESEKMGISLEKRDPDSKPITEATYFFLRIRETEWLATISPHVHVPLQFARQVVSDALGTPEREDWKSCTNTKEEEEQIVAQFAELFSDYDFNRT